MRFLISAAAAMALAHPAAVFAGERAGDTELEAMADKMADPARQAEMALTMQAMAEIMLDMPVGPMMEAMAEAAGDQARKVDRDATLRQMAPGASRVPAEIARHTPQMMGAMGAMAKGMAKMTPAMRDMARRMEQQIERALPRTPD